MWISLVPFLGEVGAAGRIFSRVGSLEGKLFRVLEAGQVVTAVGVCVIGGLGIYKSLEEPQDQPAPANGKRRPSPRQLAWGGAVFLGIGSADLLRWFCPASLQSVSAITHAVVASMCGLSAIGALREERIADAGVGTLAALVFACGIPEGFRPAVLDSLVPYIPGVRFALVSALCLF